MQKKSIIIFSVAIVMAALSGCSKDGIDQDLSFLNSDTATNPGKVFDISNDNSGNVRITPTAEGASSFVVNFGHGTGAGASAVVSPGGSVTHAYPEGSYNVTIVSKTQSGRETTSIYPLQVTYRAPENITITTTPQVHLLKVKATADYAASYQVYFGDVANETPTPLATGAEVSHTYASAGTYNVKVVALSGGAAKSEKTTSVKIYDPFGVPITFDNPSVNDFFGTFGTNQGFAQVANPNPGGINTSANVGKFIRGTESWAGTYSPLDNPIDMSVGKKLHVYVYNPDPSLIGAKLNVELEMGPIANGIAVLKVPITTSGAWEELVFDFGSISAIPANAKFKQLVLRFNDSVNGSAPGGQGTVIYVDNFVLTN
jgi:hypothetical protein